MDGFTLDGGVSLGESEMDDGIDSKRGATAGDCQPAASKDGTRLVLDFGSYIPSSSTGKGVMPHQGLSRDSLMSDESGLLKDASTISLPMVIVENMDGDTLDVGTWSGTGLPKDPIPKTSVPPRCP